MSTQWELGSKQAYRVIHYPVSVVFSQCGLVSGWRTSLTEIGADVREAVAPILCDDALYKSTFILLLTLDEVGIHWPPSPLLAVPNVTARLSTASVPITVLPYHGPLLCGYSVPKGLTVSIRVHCGRLNSIIQCHFRTPSISVRQWTAMHAVTSTSSLTIDILPLSRHALNTGASTFSHFTVRIGAVSGSRVLYPNFLLDSWKSHFRW